MKRFIFIMVMSIMACGLTACSSIKQDKVEVEHVEVVEKEDVSVEKTDEIPENEEELLEREGRLIETIKTANKFTDFQETDVDDDIKYNNPNAKEIYIIFDEKYLYCILNYGNRAEAHLIEGPSDMDGSIYANFVDDESLTSDVLN